MAALTALPRALVNAGLAKEPKEKRKHYKQFKCHVCGSPMIQIEDTNTMACEKCKQYFIFKNDNQYLGYKKGMQKLVELTSLL